jgi:hypothetical protein
MTQALYAHMNNKINKKERYSKKKKKNFKEEHQLSLKFSMK